MKRTDEPGFDLGLIEEPVLLFGQRVGGKFWLNSGAIGMPANDGSRDGWYLPLSPIDGGIRAEWHRPRNWVY